ncbi:hypothetical protein ACOSQ2_007902 [Xanthoceras sorbifolium]
MDRSREARRGVNIAASNGLSRRRHRSSSLRDSPEEDGPLELQETARLRDRKKDRDRDRDRERDRERERDRDRERDRLSRSSKRRRSDKFMHGTNREDGGEDSSDDSMNDDDEDDEDDGGTGGNPSMRMLPPNPSSSSSSMLNHHHHHNNNNTNSHNSIHSRKSFLPPAKVFRASPTVTASTAWKVADEMIGVSVPRKARSASIKRSHECWSSSAGVLGGGEQIHRQASTSPVRPSVTAVLATPAPASPSSSNASVRKKMKPNGPKPRLPKSSSNKSSSSAQDEIEIEIAEVLYGMMRQPQGPSKQEIIGADSNSRETINNNINNKSSSDAKSRVSSPISNSPSTLPQASSILPTNSSSSNAPMSAIAPKRKKPRPVKYEDDNHSAFTVRNGPISSTTKVEVDQSPKTDTFSPNLEKNSGSVAAEKGSIPYDLMSSEEPQQLESVKPDQNAVLADSKGATVESESGRGDVGVTKEEPQSPKKESTAGLKLDDDRRDHLTLTKANSTTAEIENQREEKFQIDLMAPPPLRSSPERDGEINFVTVDLQSEMKPVVKEDERAVKTVNEDASVEVEVKKVKNTAEESESQKPVVIKERNIDLQLDLEKSDRDSGTGSLTGNKINQHVQKQHHQQPPPIPEKTGQSNSLPLPLSMAGWPGGLPPMGYMAPLQGVVSMDASAVSPAAIQPPHLFSQPRPKRCATHCYIARNIHCHQQFSRMNHFWPTAPGSASLYGAKTSNLNVVPPTEMHGSIPVRGLNAVQDKGQGLAIFPGHTGKDNKGSQPAAVMDASQRKQILLQQALPPGAPNNILHAPAFIFPLSQQQAAAAVSVRPGSVKSPPANGSAASLSASNSASVSASAPAGVSAAALGFNYPNIPGNETQYLAILQNNGYPFPISAHVGAPPAYRGTHPHSMPFFNGSFYSSQMLHPSQLQQQQQQQQPLPSQSQQSQSHQNPSVSSGSSSSQKHLQNQQQRPHNNGISGGSGTLQGYPAPKNQPQQLQLQRQQQQNQQVPHQARQLESDMVGEESPSTADSRVSRANMNIYGQNFAVPLHPPNFALMSTASMGGATSSSGNHGDKKPQQQPQLQGPKAGVETLTPQTYAMSFAINGASAPGLDISSITQNPAILQSLPEAMRHGYQIMAAAQAAAQQKKSFRSSEEGKTGGNDASNVEEDRKSMAGKPPGAAQSIAFSRPDLTDTSVSAMMGNPVIDSSARTLNIGSMPARTSASVMQHSISNVNPSPAQQQMQRNQQQQQQHQMIQLQKQQQFAVAAAASAARSKTSATSNGNAYTEHLPPSSMAAKFPNALSAIPQNLVQSSSNPAQSHQWKNSVRTNTSQVTSPSLSSTTSSVKNLQQQQSRTQQNHAQISFGGNHKSSASQGQPPPSNNQSPSPPMVVGSPTTSSISKTSAGGSPRTTATTSTGNKGGQASTLSSQQAKNSPSMPSRKSSPVPSMLGNHNIISSSSGAKTQMQQQQLQLQQQQQLQLQQQQLQKHAMQQAQLLFSNAAYMQAQAQHVASTTSSATAASGFFIQRHRDQQQPQHQQQQQGASASSSSGMLSLCPPVTHSSTNTSDPAKAVAAASNMKGGGLTSQGLIHSVQFATAQSSGKPHQLVPGFTYVHTVPTAVQVKPSEQKQPAGE